MTNTTIDERNGYRKVSIILFLCLFSGQAAAIALSPVLAQVAHDFDVSTAAAGQFRTVAGLVAGVTALALVRLGARVGLGRQLLCGSGLLALGSLASAAAPSVVWLAAAQIPIGAGIAVVTTAGTLAAAEWVPPDRRTSVLSTALVGQPAAWIVGMPLIGAVSGLSWRIGWVLPLAAAVAAGVAVSRRAGRPPASTRPAELRAVFGDVALVHWLAGDLLANAAWAGTLVYAGALFTESYASSTEATGIILAVGAGAYVAGNRAFRGRVDRDPGRKLVALALALAFATALFGAVRPSVWVSAILFSAAAAAAGGRTFVSSAYGLTAPPETRVAAMALRAASMQFGYFAGTFAAGTALALGGYAAFGGVIGLLFAGAGIALAVPSQSRREDSPSGLATGPLRGALCVGADPC
jgi:DHA1 family inner membrane transport protein